MSASRGRFRSLLGPVMLGAAALHPGPAAVHDFHVSYGRMAIEGSVVVLRLRVFRDDLEAALAQATGRETFRLAAEPVVDSLFLAYLGAHFHLDADGDRLEATVIGSGEDAIDHEPAWWYLLRFDAGRPPEGVTVQNTILFDIHEDQQNLLRVIRVPDERELAYTFTTETPAVTLPF